MGLLNRIRELQERSADAQMTSAAEPSDIVVQPESKKKLFLLMVSLMLILVL